MRRSVFALLLMTAMGMAVMPAACSKKLPSSPGTPPGTPVLLIGLNPNPTIGRKIQLSGSVLNQSGRTIYDVWIEVTAALDSPTTVILIDTSPAAIPVILNASTIEFKSFEVTGDRFIDAVPLYTYLPPGP